MADAAPSPSLRRVLTGYLRLRDPYNLCLDAVLLMAASYAVGYAHEWFDLQQRRSFAGSDAEFFSAWWFGSAAIGTVAGLMYWTALGVFLMGLVRIIAASPRDLPETLS